jgi:hypothetical protein
MTRVYLKNQKYDIANKAYRLGTPTGVDTKWRLQFFVKYNYRFLLDVIIVIIDYR